MRVIISKLTEEVEVKGNMIDKLQIEMNEKNDKIKYLEKEVNGIRRKEDHTSNIPAPQSYDADVTCFNCGQCDKAFMNKKGLSTHMRIHTNKIPQVDGLNSSLLDSTFDESEKTNENNSLSRLKRLTETLSHF